MLGGIVGILINLMGPGLNELVRKHSKTRKYESKYSQGKVWRDARLSSDLEGGCGTPKELEAEEKNENLQNSWRHQKDP